MTPEVEALVGRLRGLMERATMQPWHEREGYYRAIQGTPTDGQTYGDMVTTHTGQIAAQQGQGKHNAALMVEAVNALPTLLAALSASAQEPGWRTMESAPRDGAPFLAGLFVRTNGAEPEWEQFVVWLDDETGEVGQTCEFGWDAQDIERWQPLPAAPSANAGGDA